MAVVVVRGLRSGRLPAACVSLSTVLLMTWVLARFGGMTWAGVDLVRNSVG